MKFVDDFLNNITMYRLVLYYLLGLLTIAFVFCLFGIMAFNPLGLLFSTVFLVAVCWLTNWVFAKVFEVVPNIESVYISALILALIINPIRNFHDMIFLFWAGVLAMAGKFIIARKRKHLFNPVALAVFLTSIFIGRSATWWVGNPAMMIPVTAGGILIVRKIEREKMAIIFILVATLVIRRVNIFAETPLLFFAFIMLTEPLTTPPTKNLRLIYGALVGLLFFYTPELALLAGNVFSYFVSSKKRLLLTLKEKVPIGTDTWDFIFSLEEKFSWVPGQYMEWTLGHSNPDDRGNRRYFTLASAPTENNIRIGVKFSQPASSFKRALLEMPVGGKVFASQLAGDFVLPKDPKRKLAFVAGGIGITPFRSMIKHLLDTNQQRQIVLFCTNKTEGEIAYREIFDLAQERLKIKTIYIETEKTGRMNEQTIRDNLPDFTERTFYLSGPHSLVAGFEKTLAGLEIKREKIIKDYFPGFA